MRRPRARLRYPGVGDLIRRATFLRETHDGKEEEAWFKSNSSAFLAMESDEAHGFLALVQKHVTEIVNN